MNNPLANPWRRRRPVAVTAAFLLCCAGLWTLMNADRWRTIEQLTEFQVTHDADILQRDLTSSVMAAHAIALRMANQNGDGQAPFVGDAEFFMGSFPGTRAVAFLDPDHRVAAIRPTTLSGSIGLNVADISPDRRRALETARKQNVVTMSDPVELASGAGKGFIVFFPIKRDGVFQGTISLVFAAEIWLNYLIFHQTPKQLRSDFANHITLNGQTILKAADYNETLTPHARSASVNVLNGTFEITLAPRSTFTTRHWNWTPELITLVLLTSFACLMTCLTFMARARSAEQAMARVNLRLLHGNERLREEVEVRQRAEMAAKASQAASEKFLATMSHEIRTPLNAIMGMFQLIEGADVPARQKRQAETGLKASERLFRDLTHVIDSSRIDAGAVQIYKKPFATQPLLQEWGDLLQGLVRKSDKELEAVLDFDADLPDQLWIDRTRVGQIVTNLLDNAVKFSPSGVICMSVQAQPDRADTLEIRISDSGPGVPPDLAGSIFDRFYQINDGEARPFQGSGLGLAISRELAELMGGKLDVGRADADHGANGACFTLSLPAAIAQSAENLNHLSRSST